MNRRESLSEPAYSPPTPTNQLECMCISVEAREGVTTGISAADRARTISLLGEPEPNPRRLVRPGHIFPVETVTGGVLVKHSVFEAAVDLVTACGHTDAAVVVDLLNESGDLIDTAQALALADARGIPTVSIADIVRARLEREHLISRVAEAPIPTLLGGVLRGVVYRSLFDSLEHMALVKGDIKEQDTVLVRVQPEFSFGDLFDSGSASSRGQIHAALKLLSSRSAGVLVYLRRPFGVQFAPQLGNTSPPENRTEPGIGDQPLSPSVDALRRPPWMMREYGLGAQILRDLGVVKAEVLTNSPRRLIGITSFGIEIVGQVPLEPTGASVLHDSNNSNVPG
jgi:3,4-dihydroxy 2-butanone 4-phosphate synthase/GTP cyclohydrolase II